MFVRTQTNGSRTYLLIVDNQWVDGKVKQRVLFRLSRLDELLASRGLQDISEFPGKPFLRNGLGAVSRMT